MGAPDPPRPPPGMADASSARRSDIHHEPEAITRRPPRPPLHGPAERIGRAHGSEQLTAHEPPRHQAMPDAHGFGRSPYGEAVIDPTRMVARVISPGGTVQIARLGRH